MTDLVSKFCGNVQLLIIKHAQSHVKEDGHKVSLAGGICVDHAQVDGAMVSPGLGCAQ